MHYTPHASLALEVLGQTFLRRPNCSDHTALELAHLLDVCTSPYL